jgi:hypothetical protein
LSLTKLFALRRAKKAVKEFEWVTEHPVECQEAFVLTFARTNRDTLFGKKHRLEKVRSIDDYQKLIPIQDYHTLLKYIELIRNGESDILFHGKPIWWAKTSGTTSEPKLIPVTKEMTRYNSDAGSRLLYSFMMENPAKNADILSGKLFFLRAPSRLEWINGVPVGYISGISGETQSRFAKRMVVPSKGTSEITDWEEKFYRVILETIQENVTMIVGVTPLLMSMFQRMSDEYPQRLLQDVKNEKIRERLRRALRRGEGRLRPVDCWESLKLFCPSSASIRPYMLRYRELFGDTPIREAYGATEGQFGHQDDEGKGLLLNWDKYLYEFTPFEDETGRRHNNGSGAHDLSFSRQDRLIVSELKVGSIYEVLVTTPFGLYSYRIGDVLRLESKNPYRFTIVGRTKLTLNMFGEKVCEEHVSTAVRVAEDTTKAMVSDYSCMAVTNGSGGPHYVMCVEFIKPPRNKEKFIATWDRTLQEVAPAYGCFREKDAILKSPKIVTLVRGAFRRYEDNRMKSRQAIGQLKLPHIVSERELLSGFDIPMGVNW